MQAAPIDLTSLAKALAQLREAITFWQACAPSDPLKPHLRSAVIQSFSFSDLLRAALDAGLPMPIDPWRRWRDMRNATSHTISHAHDETRAIEVATATPDFLVDAEKLLLSLQSFPQPS
jgi:hypothetical protein